MCGWEARGGAGEGVEEGEEVGSGCWSALSRERKGFDGDEPVLMSGL